MKSNAMIMKRRIFAVFASIILAIGMIVMSVLVNRIVGRAQEDIPTISDKVTIGGKVYTSDNPLKVLEILPDDDMSEIGYLMGKDCGSVKWSDILLLPQDTDEQKEKKLSVMQAWANAVCAFSGYDNNNFAYSNDEINWKSICSMNKDDLSEITSDTCISYCENSQNTGGKLKASNCYYKSDNKNKVVYNDNVFAYRVFGDYNMCDKTTLKAIKASDVTVDMLDEYDLVYINGSMHVENCLEPYKKMQTAVSNIPAAQYNLSKKYDHAISDISSSGNKFINLNEDLSAEVAMKLSYMINREEISVIFDVNAFPSNDYNSYNISKVYILSRDIEKDTCYEEYWENYDEKNNKYSGTHGSIEIDVSGDKHVLNLYMSKETDAYNNKRDVNSPVSWGPGMFAWSPYSIGNNPDVYYNVSSGEFVNHNFFTYNGNNIIGVDFATGSQKLSADTAGSSHQEVIDMYGDANKGVPNAYIVRYVLGGYRDYRPVTKIRVLEIDPAGVSKYDNYEGAVKISKYMGINFPGMNSDNYKEKVQVKSIASNGFIAMTDNIENNYDLVIVSDYNNGTNGVIKTNPVYQKYAEIMKLDEKLYNTSENTTINENIYAAMSGNDFTDKALNKIYQYIDSGKPIVIASSIYNSNVLPTNQFTMSKEGTNVYKLSSANLNSIGKLNGDSNILCEPQNADSQYKKLQYKQAPDITIDSDYKISYNNDMVGSLIDSDNLSEFKMKGKINDEKGVYNLKVYFDKDGDGLFTDIGIDSSELYFDDTIETDDKGEFEILINLPTNMRGYVKWKAEASEINKKYASEDSGAIAIKYNSNEIKTINVLQIIPGSKTNLDMGSGSKFDTLFKNVEEITGLKLNVTTKTTDQFEKMYNQINYRCSEDYKDYNNLNKNKLYNYDMVVIGCADNFNNADIDNESALNNLQDFINMGKSVLFTHDTMIYSAYSDGNNNNKHLTKDKKAFYTAYYLTSRFRDLIGMDRFHASIDNNGQAYQQGFSNAFLMKRATYGGSRYNMYNGMNNNATGKTITTNVVTKLNTGQITEYPYAIADDLNVAPTHAQWFQLNLEGNNSDYSDSHEDVIVWYTLNSTDTIDSEKDENKYPYSNYYSLAGQDALNNYYIYSKGNVTYSGAGHSNVSGENELKLFVNTVIKAYGSGNNTPEIQVEDEVSLGNNVYEKYLRSFPKSLNELSELSDNDKEALRQETKVTFIPSDIDMGASTSVSFEKGDIYWDVDQDGSYSDGDVILKQYGSNSLYNRTEETVYLYDYIDSLKDDSQKNDYYKAILDGKLSIGIRVFDEKNLSGQCRINIISRELFKLD